MKKTNILGVYVDKVTYDEAVEKVPFSELPNDWTCPLCKHPKSDFELKLY